MIPKAEQIKFDDPYENGYPYGRGYGVVSLTGRFVSHEVQNVLVGQIGALTSADA